jgi:hypothetical protein
MYGLYGEIRKLMPPSFDGERERKDDVEAWLLVIKKYLLVSQLLLKYESIIAT